MLSFVVFLGLFDVFLFCFLFWVCLMLSFVVFLGLFDVKFCCFFGSV